MNFLRPNFQSSFSYFFKKFHSIFVIFSNCCVMWLACRLIGALFRDSAIFVLDVLFTVTCSQTLYFLFKVRRARVIEYKPQAIYWPPAQGGSGGGRRNIIIISFFSRSALASLGSRACQCFRKERKEKWNNVCIRAIYLQGFSGDFFRQNASFFFTFPWSLPFLLCQVIRSSKGPWRVWRGCCLVVVRRFPSLCRPIHFGDVSEANIFARTA